MRKFIVPAVLVLLISVSLAVVPVEARSSAGSRPSEYSRIVKHLKSKYRAKKVKIPFMWLARFAVSVVRPAGVKSFSVTLFEDLKFSRETLDVEMQSAMKNSFGGSEWSSILRARTADGQQVYMYMREANKNVRVAMVVIDKQNAAVVRATFSPERLADFINDPKVFGISLNDRPDTGKSDSNRSADDSKE
jgi:hypothetical protein